MPYGKDNVKKRLALLLGGCETVLANPLIRAQAFNEKPDLSKKELKEATMQLKKGDNLWTSDFGLIENYFRNKHCIVWGSYPTVPRAYKEDAVKLLKSFFCQPASTHVVYWSGHGRRRNGNWCFAGNVELDLDELLQLYRESFDPLLEYRTLIIYSDTCHAGYWTQQLATREEYQLNVILQGAALDAEQAFIVEGTKPRSLLMRKFISEQTSEDPSNFVWTCKTQHPDFAVSHCLLESGKCAIIETQDEVICTLEDWRFSTLKKQPEDV